MVLIFIVTSMFFLFVCTLNIYIAVRVCKLRIFNRGCCSRRDFQPFILCRQICAQVDLQTAATPLAIQFINQISHRCYQYLWFLSTKCRNMQQTRSLKGSDFKRSHKLAVCRWSKWEIASYLADKYVGITWHQSCRMLSYRNAEELTGSESPSNPTFHQRKYSSGGITENKAINY